MADRSLLRSRGEALEPSTRRLMESRIGVDLSAVRIHRGETDESAARALNARAFTVGRDITFAPGEFQPDTRAGQHLLAHELTHVVQQSRSSVSVVQRQPKPTTPDWQSQLDDILPRRVGLIVHIDRLMQLMERYNDDQLRELVGLIHADAAASKFTREEAGVPGIFALDETRVGQRLDVEAARFLMKTFPTRRNTARKSEEKTAAVFSEDVVRDAYIRFHLNAILPDKGDPKPPDLPDKIRQNCIAIVHDLAPKLFTSDEVVKRIDKEFARLRKKGETYTMVHTGDTLAAIGVAGSRIEIHFKDAKGKATNGNTEPKNLTSSAWDKVVAAVGSDYGWHVFGMAIMDGFHSVTLFVDNQPEGMTLFWADQWRIDPGDDFHEVKGSISGFREYQKTGFDQFIEEKTNEWWNEVHSSTSDCATKRHPKDWDEKCRYDATLMLWHMKKVKQKP